MKRIALSLPIGLLLVAAPSSADTGSQAPAPVISPSSTCAAVSTPEGNLLPPGPQAWTEAAPEICSVSCGPFAPVSCTGLSCEEVYRYCATGEPGSVECDGERIYTCPDCLCIDGQTRQRLAGCCCWLPTPKSYWVTDVCVNEQWQATSDYTCWGTCPGPPHQDPCPD